jgi:hypothetical protein
MRSIEKMPKSIVHAVCAIQKSLDAVSKTQKNQHGGYMFASTDDVYAALTRKMGEVGLMIVSFEDNCEIVRLEKDGKTVQWARFEYSYLLATEEDTWTDERLKRTLFIQLTGPQSFQAAQSYAEKSFFRSLFKIPTGDMDLDSMAQAETVEGQASINGGGGKRKSSHAAKKDGTTQVFEDIRAKIRDAKNAEILSQIPDLYADELSQMPTQWSVIISNEYEDRMEALRS